MDTKALSPKYFFHVADGQVIGSIGGLYDSLRAMSDSTYSYHANDYKNDFATWLKDFFPETGLSEKIRSSSRNEAANQIWLYMTDRKDTLSNVEIEPAQTHAGFSNILRNILIMIQQLSEKTFSNKNIAQWLKALYMQEYQRLSKKIKGLEKKGEDVSKFDLLLKEIDIKIKRFNSNSAEEDAFVLAHLFYCLAEEIEGVIVINDNIVSALHSMRDELDKRICKKYKGQEIPGCKYDFLSLENCIIGLGNTHDESVAFDIIRLLYSIEASLGKE